MFYMKRWAVSISDSFILKLIPLWDREVFWHLRCSGLKSLRRRLLEVIINLTPISFLSLDISPTWLFHFSLFFILTQVSPCIFNPFSLLFMVPLLCLIYCTQITKIWLDTSFLSKIHTHFGYTGDETGPYVFAWKIFLRENKFKDSIPNYRYNVAMQTTCKFKHAKWFLSGPIAPAKKIPLLAYPFTN